MIPAATDVHWSVSESLRRSGRRGRNTTLSPYGGWEAEWNIPEKAKLGSYEIRALSVAENYEGRDM